MRVQVYWTVDNAAAGALVEMMQPIYRNYHFHEA